MHRYLIVANQTLGSDELMRVIRDRAAGGPAEFWLVVPATPVTELASNAVPVPMPVMGGVLPLPHAPEEARQRAQANLAAALERLSSAGLTADGEVCDADPVPAVTAAVAAREVDEIVVATLPARLSRWLHQDLPGRLTRTSHVPVTHVALPDV